MRDEDYRKPVTEEFGSGALREDMLTFSRPIQQSHDHTYIVMKLPPI
jgi:hypothetical protein